MAKDRNTFAKRQREVRKREKSELKREKRLQRKSNGNDPNESLAHPYDEIPDDRFLDQDNHDSPSPEVPE